MYIHTYTYMYIYICKYAHTCMCACVSGCKLDLIHLCEYRIPSHISICTYKHTQVNLVFECQPPVT